MSQQDVSPSRRRTVRTALGLAGLGAVSGCLDRLRASEPAFLSYKSITVGWPGNRVEGYVADLCWLWSDGRSRLFGWAPGKYPDVVRSPGNVVVSNATARRLRDRFSRVKLVVGFSHVDTTDLSLLESDLGQIAVPREEFNRVQFGDRIRVTPTSSDVRIHGVQRGQHGDPADWDISIGTKTLTDQFPDSGVPEPR